VGYQRHYQTTNIICPFLMELWISDILYLEKFQTFFVAKFIKEK